MRSWSWVALLAVRRFLGAGGTRRWPKAVLGSLALITVAAVSSSVLHRWLLGLDLPPQLAPQGLALTLVFVFGLSGSAQMLLENSRATEALALQRTLSPLPISRTKIAVHAWLPSCFLQLGVLVLVGIVAFGVATALGLEAPEAFILVAAAELAGAVHATFAAFLARVWASGAARPRPPVVGGLVWAAGFVGAGAVARDVVQGAGAGPWWGEAFVLNAVLAPALQRDGALLGLGVVVTFLIVAVMLYARSLGLGSKPTDGDEARLRWSPHRLARFASFELVRMLRSPTTRANCVAASLLGVGLAAGLLRVPGELRAEATHVVLLGALTVLSSPLVVCRNLSRREPPIPLRLGVPPWRWVGSQIAAASVLLVLTGMPVVVLGVAVGRPASFEVLCAVTAGAVTTIGAAVLVGTVVRPIAERPGTQALAAMGCVVLLSICFIGVEILDVGRTTANLVLIAVGAATAALSCLMENRRYASPPPPRALGAAFGGGARRSVAAPGREIL